MKINEQTDSTFERKFVTGPVVFNNVLINPTMKEAQEYGLNYIKEEPNYIGKTEEGTPKIDIVVYGKVVGNQDIILSQKFTIEASNWISQSGKTCYLRFNGVTSWADSEDDLPDWFKQGEYRKALKGEEAFYNFVLAFNNTRFDELTSFEVDKEDYQKMFKGDFSGVKLFNQVTDNKWLWICYIDEYNDKLYNKVYNRQTFKHWESTPYLYEAKEKKGKVDWEYFIDYLVNIDVDNKFNPVYITPSCEVYTLDEIKVKIQTDTQVKEPVFKETKPSDNLPF